MPVIRTKDTKKKDKNNMSAEPVDTEPSEIKITPANKAYQSADSDFSLYSSDGILFKVHRAHLMVASPVFQSLLSLETSSTPELRLCDSSIEAQHTIRIVLDLIYGKPLQAPTRCFQKLKNTYDVLMKYDCAAALQTYKMAVRAWAVDTKANKLSVFIIGAHMDDVEACATALQRDGHSMWRSTKEVEDLDDLVHLDDTEGIPPSLMAPQVAGYCFDPTSLTFDIYDAIPRVYMLALIHATDPSDHDCEDCCCSGGHCSFEHVDLNQASETFRVMLNSRPTKSLAKPVKAEGKGAE